jgi:hypothetical protein
MLSLVYLGYRDLAALEEAFVESVAFELSITLLVFHKGESCCSS